MTDLENQNQSEYIEHPDEESAGQNSQGWQSHPGDGASANPDGGQYKSSPGGGQQGQDPYGQQGQYPYGQQGQYPYGQQGQSPYGGQYNMSQGGGPYNNEPYYNSYNQPYGGPYDNRPPKKPKNGFATVSLICGIFSILFLCCFAFPLSIIMGVGAISFAVISKKGQPFYGTAIAGIILGAFAVVLGVGEFAYFMYVSTLLKDPENAALVNEFLRQLEYQMQQVR